MTAPALPEDLNALIHAFISATICGSAEDFEVANTALRAAIARALPPPVAPTVEAALAALDTEQVLDGWNRVAYTNIVGLDDVRAAHRAEVARAVADRNDAQKRLAAAIIDATDAANRAARLEAALRKIAAAGPSKDPCADEYDADGKRWTSVGAEATWCVYESDESSEMVDHAADVAAYSLAVEARAALEEPCKCDSPEAAEEDKS